MKSKAVLIAAIAAAIGIVPGALSAQEQKGPRIEVNEARHDFGKVPQGRQAVHVFEIRNAGDAILEIQKIQTS